MCRPQLGCAGGLLLYLDHYEHAPFAVTRRRGIDTHPVDVTTDDGARLLQAFVWPGHGDRMERLRAAIDAGLVINPDGIINQTEGGIIQTVSWALKEQVQYDRSRILTQNWDDYPILTFEEVPDVEVTIVHRPDMPPLGAGEGAQGPTASAIANAVFNAMGVRLRDMPFTRDRVMAAMA